LAALILSSVRVATHRNTGSLPTTDPCRRMGLVTILISLRALAETHKKLLHAWLAPNMGQLACDCNSCRYRIVKEPFDPLRQSQGDLYATLFLIRCSYCQKDSLLFTDQESRQLVASAPTRNQSLCTLSLDLSPSEGIGYAF